MKRESVLRVIAALVLATAVLATLSMQSINLPLPVEMQRFLSLYWTLLSYNIVFLLGLVCLLLKFRQRMPWYISLPACATALAFFCWQLLPDLLNEGVYLVSGREGFYHIYLSAQQTYPAFFATYLVYGVGMLVWGFSALLKGVLPRWAAVLLMLFGVDNLLRWPVVSTWGPFIPTQGFHVLFVPDFVYGTPYGFVRCLLLAGLAFALWMQPNSPTSMPSEPSGASPAPTRSQNTST